MTSEKTILFEPWGLGDALIALAAAIQDSTRIAIACNPRWIPLLRAVTHDMQAPDLMPVSLDYVSRSKSRSFDLGKRDGIKGQFEVLTIRGDMRDYLAARRMFPSARVKMTGWYAFLAKRSPIFDLPFSTGLIQVNNRYEAWASLAKVRWADVVKYYSDKSAVVDGPIVIHVGANYQSRQYPHVADLIEHLQDSYPIRILAGPNDPLPEGIKAEQVCHLVDGEIVEALKASRLVITNDSGPMHLAAILRCRTIVVTRQAAIREWLPPTATAIESIHSPKGYRSYPLSDRVWTGWPTAEEVAKRLAQLPL